MKGDFNGIITKADDVKSLLALLPFVSECSDGVRCARDVNQVAVGIRPM